MNWEKRKTERKRKINYKFVHTIYTCNFVMRCFLVYFYFCLIFDCCVHFGINPTNTSSNKNNSNNNNHAELKVYVDVCYALPLPFFTRFLFHTLFVVFVTTVSLWMLLLLLCCLTQQVFFYIAMCGFFAQVQRILFALWF